MPKKLLALSSLAAVLLTASAAPAVTPGEDTGVMVDALVLDHAGNPVAGLNRGDFEVIVGDRIRPVAGVRMVAAETAPRRFVFVFNRRGALPAQLKRAQRGLAEFVSSRFGDLDEALFVDFAEVPRITRGWRTGSGEALPEVHNITPMGFRSPVGAAQDAADAAFMLHALAERLVEVPGRKMVIPFSGSLSSFSWTAEQPGTIRKADLPRIRSDPRGQLDAGLAPITQRLGAAQATVHVLHLAGVQELEERILTANRGELSVDEAGVHGTIFSSTTREGRQRAVSPRSADDILSSLLRPRQGFRKPLDRIAARNERWYRLSLVGEDAAAERQSGVPQVRVPGCSDCTVLPATNPE